MSASQSNWLVSITLLLIVLFVQVVESIETNSTCDVGVCSSITWTQPRFPRDSNKSTFLCECQDIRNDEIQDAAMCTGYDEKNRPIVELKTGFCMTFDEQSNLTFMGRCPYNHLQSGKFSDPLVALPPNVYDLNDFMCNGSYELNYVCGQQRREGLLCGKCQSGLGPAVASYTYQCVECHWYGLLQYLTYIFAPATVFCFIIIILRVNLLSPPMNAIVLLCHVLTCNFNLNPCTILYYAKGFKHMPLVISILITIYGFFNMDFFPYVMPPFCISDKMSTIQVVTLDYIVAVYPLVFTALIYILIEVRDRGFRPLVLLWSPFHRCLVRLRKSWNIKGSVINAFATFYVLSFTKVVSTTVNLLLTAHMVDVCGRKHSGQLYYDASCHIFHRCHLPYAVLSITVFVFFIFVPTFAVLFYSCRAFHKYCCCCLTRRLTLFNEIVKIFHQSFKDGTDGTRDYRWFAGIYLVLRTIIVTSLLWRSSQQYHILSSMAGLLFVAVFQPHVSNSYNYIDSFIFGGLTVIFVLLPASQSRHIAMILIYIVPLILMLIQLCWRYKSYYIAAFHKCRTKSNFDHSCHDLAKENKPLLKKVEVTQTVVDFKSYGK